MCMEDYDLGREQTWQEITVLSTGVWQPLMSGDPRRVSIIFGSPIAGANQYSTKPNAATDGGLLMSANQQPLPIKLLDHGLLIASQWFVKNVTAGTTITVFVSSLTRV